MLSVRIVYLLVYTHFKHFNMSFDSFQSWVVLEFPRAMFVLVFNCSIYVSCYTCSWQVVRLFCCIDMFYLWRVKSVWLLAMSLVCFHISLVSVATANLCVQQIRWFSSMLFFSMFCGCLNDPKTEFCSIKSMKIDCWIGCGLTIRMTWCENAFLLVSLR